MRRRWRRSICGFAIFSPWGEPKLRVGVCSSFRSGLAVYAKLPGVCGSFRSGTAVCAKPPGACGSLRSEQVVYANRSGNTPSSGEAHSGSGSSREGRARGLGFAAGPSGPETSGGAGARDWGAQPMGRRAIPERLLLACPV